MVIKRRPHYQWLYLENKVNDTNLLPIAYTTFFLGNVTAVASYGPTDPEGSPRFYMKNTSSLYANSGAPENRSTNIAVITIGY